MKSFVWMFALLFACGGEETPTPPVAPQPIMPGQPTPGQPGQPVGQPVGQPIGQPLGQPGQAGASNFGTLTLATGFAPDPQIAQGTSGGAIQAGNLNSTCRGYISQTPDHIVMAQTPFAALRLVVNGGAADTTLVVQNPAGAYSCDDDSEQRNPAVTIAAATPGAYKVWVGSYNQGEQAPYTLGVSSNAATAPSAVPAPAGAPTTATGPGLTPTPAGTSNFGTVSLRAGFTPDPTVAEGTSGGSINASTLAPGCAGWISNTPDHLLNATTAFAYLRVMARSTEDTTLVIQRPDNTFVCNDDGLGQELNPLVSAPFPAGTYKIWVGSYNQGANSRYHLGFSELSTVNTSNLPQ